MSSRGIQLIEEETAVELQHINIKLLLRNPEVVDLEAMVPVFHSWIQQQSAGELLLDVASYAHVKDGPGVLLIGHEADYSLDATGGRLGLRYNRKALVEGSNQQKLHQAARAALSALQRLEQDAHLNRNIQFDGKNIELFINDRLLAPNIEQTRQAAEPEIREFLNVLGGGSTYSSQYEFEPRRLFGARIQLEREFTVQELLNNLSHAAGQHAGL